MADTIPLSGVCRYVVILTKCISSLSVYSLSKQLAEYPDWENTGEASAGGKQSIPVLTTPHRAGAAGFTLGAPAVDRGGRIFNCGRPNEKKQVAFRCFISFKLLVLNVDFSGGIRWSITRSFVNVLVSS